MLAVYFQHAAVGIARIVACRLYVLMPAKTYIAYADDSTAEFERAVGPVACCIAQLVPYCGRINEIVLVTYLAHRGRFEKAVLAYACAAYGQRLPWFADNGEHILGVELDNGSAHNFFL